MSEGTGTGPERRPGSAPRANAAQTPEAIEAQLNAQREALSASVDELVARVDPRTQARQAGEDLRDRADTTAAELRARASDLVGRARRTIEDARAGDSEAVKRVAAVAGGAFAVSLIAGRLLRR